MISPLRREANTTARSSVKAPMLRRLAFTAAIALLGLSPRPAEGVVDHTEAKAQAATMQSTAAQLQPAEGADEPAPPTWRWRKEDKPVKVVVLAGSIGAFKRRPYAQQLAGMCSNIEVKNISQTGLGAWALKKHFEAQVLGNNRLRWNVEGEEYWLIFGGGLNSVGNPRSTNHHMRRLFELAHRRGMKAIGLTISPWGDESDKRWRDLAGLTSRRNTLGSVDFVLGRLTPAEALGNFAEKRRVGADAPWDPKELPDIAIDLYDSRLRDREAEPRDIDAMRALLEKSKSWNKAHKDLDELQRQTKLEADALEASQIPQWYLRKELRSFDHIHPNADGHQIIAETICVQMPESWGCTCPSPDAGAAEAQ